MCIKYIRRYNCPQGNGQPNAEHALLSTIPCSNPIACVGDGFGTRDVSFPGPCEQHTSPNDWATFANLAPVQDTLVLSDNPEDLNYNIRRYIDNLLDLLVVSMNEALPKAVVETDYVTLQSAVETIARELRCPRCDDDITVCPCPPGQNRPIYNISRAFRTAEAQRLLPLLRHRFGEGVVQQAALQTSSYAAGVNRQGPQGLLFDFEPPTHDAVVLRTRRFCHALEDLQKRRVQLLDQGDELGRTQWSAVSIIGSYLKFDTGLPEDIADILSRIMFPLLYPRKGLQERAYRFGTTIDAGADVTRIQIVSSRLTDPTFWTTYQDLIQQYTSLFSRDDEHRKDLNAIAVALDDRMDDVRNTFHDLRQEERETFHAIAKDLLPVTEHVTTEELDRSLGGEGRQAKCTVCGLPFSLRQQEPVTPAFCTYPYAYNREEQVHLATRYEECAFVPNEHAFCLREWARQLMSRGADNAITGVKAKEHWRCNRCFVDPWSAA